MKIRSGFVSNSSSSSFVVRVREWGLNPKMLIDWTTFHKLMDYGFKPSKDHLYASRVEEGVKPHKARSFEGMSTGIYSLWYSVVCNQDDVIEWLVRNDIPFTASCHYGHESVFWDGKSKYVTTLPNYGRQAETYGLHEEIDYRNQTGKLPPGAGKTKVVNVKKMGWNS